MISLNNLRAAQERLRGVTIRTPLIQHPTEQVWFKPESLQPIGAFKLRGAYNKVACLSAEEQRRGVITYSSGNHAQGVAYAAHAVDAKAVIVMPSDAPKVKVDGTAKWGAEIVFVGPSSGERQQKAEELASKHGYVIIPPYDDEHIIAGQGTAGLEITEDMPDVETVLVPIGGGGLISGIAAAVKLTAPKAKVVGVEPELANDAERSFRAGKIVEMTGEETCRTLADGLRTQHVGVRNFEHIRAYVDDIVTVSEEEIRTAVRDLAHNARLVAEPSGAVTFAAWRRERFPKSVCVISGGNIEPALLAELVHQV